MSISDRIIKATDEKLTSENWEYIIGACDAITTSNDAIMQEAFKTIHKRLESPAGNTQLFTLTLLNALAQSGGPKVKKAIASPETCSNLTNLSKTSHNAVKQRINDILGDLAEAVGDEDFTRFTERLKNSKRDSVISIASKSQARDEEEQFQRALRLSMQDQSSGKATTTPQQARRKNVPTHDSSDTLVSNNEIMQKVNKPMPPIPQETRRVKALYEFTSSTPGDLSFRPGQVITIVENSHRDWWKGTLDGEVGIFPANYVEYINEQAPTTEEDYIFAQAPNVEKLLSIFASASMHPGYSIVGNQNIQTMYDEVLSLRPQLIRLIDEYSARKQKLMQLNRDVMEARTRYEDLVNARMSGAASAHGTTQYSQSHSPERGRLDPQHLLAATQSAQAQGGQCNGSSPSQPSYNHSEHTPYQTVSHRYCSSGAPSQPIQSVTPLSHQHDSMNPGPITAPHYSYAGTPSAPAATPTHYSPNPYGTPAVMPLDTQTTSNQHPRVPVEPAHSVPPALHVNEQRSFSQQSQTTFASSSAHPAPPTSMPSSPNYTSDSRRTSNTPSATSLPYPV